MADTPRHPRTRQPSDWVRRFAPLIPEAGHILDLAAGAGRHTRFLHDRGHPVTAVDRDASDLGDLSDLPDMEIIEADLEDGSPWPLAGRAFSGIVVTNYLHRPLFPAILAALEPGGVLLYETFALGNERHGRPSNPDHLLRPGELLDAVCGRLQVVAYEHGRTDRPRPAVIQRLCAVNSDAVPALPPASTT